MGMRSRQVVIDRPLKFKPPLYGPKAKMVDLSRVVDMTFYYTIAKCEGMTSSNWIEIMATNMPHLKLLTKESKPAVAFSTNSFAFHLLFPLSHSE
jgi:hypothetical protein